MSSATTLAAPARSNLAGKYLTVGLDREAYGIAVLKVREIIRMQKITPVPQMPPYIKGVINLRGRVIPVVDLRIKFGLEAVVADRTCIVVVQVTVRPLGDDPVKIWLDDFTLLSDKDGQRAMPFQPSQIAGAGAIIVKNAATGKSSTTVMNQGAGGTIMGMPTGGPMMGNGASATPSAEIEVKDAQDNTDSPLLLALRQKVLPEKAVTEPVTGLLYFQIEGKVKPKNLELFYKTRSGKLGLRFVPEKGEKAK